MAYKTAALSAPLGAVATLRVVDFFKLAFDAVLTWNARRVTRKALAKLSPEQLDDIGVSLGDFA